MRSQEWMLEGRAGPARRRALRGTVRFRRGRWRPALACAFVAVFAPAAL